MIRNEQMGESPGRVTRTLAGFAAMFMSLAALLAAGCGSTAELSSPWNNNEVTIDGSAKDWNGRLSEIKDTHVLLGVRNDQDYVYLCLMTSEPQFRRQMMGPGLTVWFESEDGKKMGIHYPMGFMNREATPSYGQEGTPGAEERGRSDLQAFQDLEILGPGKNDRNLLSPLHVPGITVKFGSSQGSTVYELKVPLRESIDHPYAAGVVAGSTLKLGIETGKYESGGARQGGGRGGGMGGGMGGGRRGGGGGPGGMPGGGRSGGGRPGGETGGGSRPDPLDFRAEVHLAGSATQ